MHRRLDRPAPAAAGSDARSLFRIQPDVELDVMRPEQQLPELTAGLVRGLAQTLPLRTAGLGARPGRHDDDVLGALAAFYEAIPIGHVEAGLRTRRPTRPSRRRQTGGSSIARVAPLLPDAAECGQSSRGRASPGTSILVTGNTVIDALHWAVEQRAAGCHRSRRARAPDPAHTAPPREPRRADPRSSARGRGARQERATPRSSCPSTPIPRCATWSSRARRASTGVELCDPLDYLSLVQVLDSSRPRAHRLRRACRRRRRRSASRCSSSANHGAPRGDRRRSRDARRHGPGRDLLRRD